jgi:hypothetical protein
MPKHRLRATLLIAIVVVIIAYAEGREQQTNPQQPGPSESREGAVRNPEAAALARTAGNSEALSQMEQSAECATKEGASTDGSARIGDFVRPDGAPDYEIIPFTVDQEHANREGARAAELLVDTQTKSEADYLLIARDIKARYSEYDAVTVQFTDLSAQGIPYNGGALIFNTPCGALHLGYVYGPPNRDGYVVAAGAPPALYP